MEKFKNLDKVKNPNSIIEKELSEAKIDIHYSKITIGDIKESIIGNLYSWYFIRENTRYLCQGAGIPIEDANILYDKYKDHMIINKGKPITPIQASNGLGIGFYYVYTQEGLNALAETIMSVINRYKK